MAERLSDLDAVFLAADTPTQHMHVLATLLIESDLQGEDRYKKFRERIGERYHLIAPLRRRLRELPIGPPVWIDDPDIHLDRHLHHVVVDGGGLDAVARVASEVASYSLPRDRPLWEAWFVDGLDDGRAAVIAKVHHAALDGVSGFMALAAFFDFEPDPPATAPLEWQPQPAPTMREVSAMLATDLRGRPREVVRSARRVTSSALAMLRSRSDDTPLPMTAPRLSFNRSLTARRSTAFTSVPLDAIKELRRAHGVTVNDIVMGICAGVLRRHLSEQDATPERALVAAVPTSERSGEHGLLGNHLSFMFYALPAHLSDPRERLLAAQRSATAVKDLYARDGVGLLRDIAALVAPQAVGPLMRAVSGANVADVVPPIANVTVSNIRGPEFPLYVAGSRLIGMFPMGPLLEGVGLGITVATYREDVGFGFIACPDLLPDVSALADAVHVEVERLRAAAEGA